MKWMPPYWNNKALPTTTLTDTFIFNFLIISFILIKKKCYSDVIWKGRKKSSNPGRWHQKEYDTRFTTCAAGVTTSNRPL